MYENIFTYNFIPNFLISLFFLIINIIFSIKFSRNDSVSKLFFFDEFQPIVIFFLSFCVYIFFLNTFILINYELISEIFFLIFLSQVLLIILNLKKDKFLISFKYSLNKKIILLVIFSLFLISILPISDADSISVYQYLPSRIFNQGLEEINLYQNLEFTLLSNTETLLLISPILKSDNFGSVLNLITLLFFILITFKKRNHFSFIILSSPLIIYFISAQKLQLFFGLLYLLSFILINKKSIARKWELFILILLLTFYSSGKISYILFTIPLFLYFFYKNFQRWKDILIYLFISFVIIYLPIFALKQIYFGNFFAPFFDNLIGNNLDAYNAFVYSIRSSSGWISDPSNILLYLRPFISFDLSHLTSSLGLVFLIMLIDFKLHKKTNFIPLILIILVLATGQILPRYYFEAFLLLAYFYHPQKVIVKLFIYSQVFVIFLISSIFIYFAYIKYEVIQNKSKYMNKFTYSFFNSSQLKKNNLDGNILDFSLDRHSVFIDKNVYSLRYLTILNNFNNQNKQNMKNFIKKNSIRYLIINSDDQAPNCLITKKIGNTYRKTAVRNFLVNPNKEKYEILEIITNKCN